MALPLGGVYTEPPVEGQYISEYSAPYSEPVFLCLGRTGICFIAACIGGGKFCAGTYYGAHPEIQAFCTYRGSAV